MNPNDSIRPDEFLARAITSEIFDGTELSPSAMWQKKGETSVSRLEILGIEELTPIWKHDLHKPPGKELLKAAIFTLDELQEVYGEFQAQQNQPTNDFVLVQPDPCPVVAGGKNYSVYPQSDFHQDCRCKFNADQLHCPVVAKICPDPCPRNKAHAVIATKISRGLGNRLNAFLKKHERIQDLPLSTEDRFG